MTVTFQTGKLGSGKTLGTVALIFQRIKDKKRVATNLDLFFDNWSRDNYSFKFQAPVYRIPDFPTIVDFENIGLGNPTLEGDRDDFDPKQNGLLVLDECSMWFDNHGWQSKERKAIRDWMVLARKKGWDVIFIIQDIDVIDVNIKKTTAQYVTRCTNFDDFPVPVINPIVQAITGKRITMPAFHTAVTRIGISPTGMIQNSFMFKSKDLYKLYDTNQAFKQTDDGIRSYLSPYQLKGRYLPKKDYRYYNNALISKSIHVTAITSLLAIIPLGLSTYHLNKKSEQLSIDLTKVLLDKHFNSEKDSVDEKKLLDSLSQQPTPDKPLPLCLPYTKYYTGYFNNGSQRVYISDKSHYIKSSLYNLKIGVGYIDISTDECHQRIKLKENNKKQNNILEAVGTVTATQL